MVATFLGCAVVTHCLPHTSNFFLSNFKGLESLVLSFLFEYTN